jgi:hypothetical protein
MFRLMDHLNVPLAVRPYADQVVAVTDAVCREHLDQEYADLCRRVMAKLARKRPSPLTRGDLRIWAAGIVHATGQLNFLFDPSQSPHATTDQLSEWLGVKKTTLGNKGRLIRDTLKLSVLDTEFIRHDLIDANPLTWLVRVDGMLVDIRHQSVQLRVQAFELGLIPYVPGASTTGIDEADRLLEVITVDCYNLAEQVTAFYETFAEEVPLPATAALVGGTVQVIGMDIAVNGEELIARCRREDHIQDLSLTDLVFPPKTAAAWIHAAYRRCLGLEPHPAAIPEDWKPSWA